MGLGRVAKLGSGGCGAIHRSCSCRLPAARQHAPIWGAVAPDVPPAREPAKNSGEGPPESPECSREGSVSSGDPELVGGFLAFLFGCREDEEADVEVEDDSDENEEGLPHAHEAQEGRKDDEG